MYWECEWKLYAGIKDLLGHVRDIFDIFLGFLGDIFGISYTNLTGYGFQPGLLTKLQTGLA